MANDKEKKVEQLKPTAKPSANDVAKATLRKAYHDTKQSLCFDRGDKQEEEVLNALRKLGIAFTYGDMPHATADGITYKHTVFIKDIAALQAILGERD